MDGRRHTRVSGAQSGGSRQVGETMCDFIYHKYCFGIISPNDYKLENVILSFNVFQGKYIKSLPLHDSQQILIDNDVELRNLFHVQSTQRLNRNVFYFYQYSR